jgi:hypothetical protein
MYRSVRPVTWGQSAESPCTVRSARCLTGRWSCSSRHELVGREIVETRMRPHFVVPPPCFDDHLCLGAGGETIRGSGTRRGTCREAFRDTILPGRGAIDAVPMPCTTIQNTLARHLQPCRPPQPMACRRRTPHAHQFLRRLPSSPRSRVLARQPASSVAHSRRRAASAAGRRLRQL